MGRVKNELVGGREVSSRKCLKYCFNFLKRKNARKFRSILAPIFLKSVFFIMYVIIFEWERLKLIESRNAYTKVYRV